MHDTTCCTHDGRARRNPAAPASDLAGRADFFEGNGPTRQGLCGLDFQPCLSSELSSPSVIFLCVLGSPTAGAVGHGQASSFPPALPALDHPGPAFC